jgi:hypothetical protein
MLLTITTTQRPADDLGYLLHKHPGRFQSFDLSFGRAHVFYPEVGGERCSACLLLDVDPVGMVRGKSPDQNFLLAQYVNDRPYTASSFLAVQRYACRKTQGTKDLRQTATLAELP